MSGLEAEAQILDFEPKMVYVGFSTIPSNLISRVIRAVTRSSTSHVWLIVSLFGVRCVVEAGDFGFFPSMTFDRFRKKNKIVAVIPAFQNLDIGLRWAAESFGEKYDYGGLLGMAAVMIGRFFHRRWRNPFGSRKALFCSEAIAEVLQRSGFPGTEDLVPEETTPDQILTIVREEADRRRAARQEGSP